MKKIKNQYIKTQCMIIKTGIVNYKNGLQLAARKDDGSLDKEEQKFIAAITKDMDRLEQTIEKYVEI